MGPTRKRRRCSSQISLIICRSHEARTQSKLRTDELAVAYLTLKLPGRAVSPPRSFLISADSFSRYRGSESSSRASPATTDLVGTTLPLITTNRLQWLDARPLTKLTVRVTHMAPTCFLNS